MTMHSLNIEQSIKIDIYRIIKRIWGKKQKTKLKHLKGMMIIMRKMCVDCPETWSFFREIRLFRSKIKRMGNADSPKQLRFQLTK